ncbi:MAG TPA: GYD domain-containing protein [Dongiaceae bacterium]
MAKYIMLVNWTEQGARNVKESPKRLDVARGLAKKLGAEMKDFYMTMGEYDMVAQVDAPDDATVAKFALALATGGNVRTKTLKAFSEADYRSIIGSLS